MAGGGEQARNNQNPVGEFLANVLPWPLPTTYPEGSRYPWGDAPSRPDGKDAP